ncbi:hypothetical protein LJB81_02790 [Desulfovibrio sp. OttesenSCG-928-M14]|nr:hypothetical protein [Desulfovibrio sp. OttesenSCG-928-M14]
MKKSIQIMAITFLLLLCASGILAAAPVDNPNFVQRHAWQGAINDKIPVSIWCEIRDGLIVGELVYTNTKEKKPIRLLGTVEADGELRMQEMLPDGLISGLIGGKITQGSFEGAWSAPGKLVTKGNNHEYIEGKSYHLRLSNATLPHTPFHWEHDPNALAGKYAYSYGKDMNYGVIALVRAEGQKMNCSIDSSSSAPSYNMAQTSFTTGAAGDRILYEEDASCAFEILLFNGFLVTRYLEGKTCDGWFGRGTTVEGIFVKQE